LPWERLLTATSVDMCRGELLPVSHVEPFLDLVYSSGDRGSREGLKPG
jgi:hypothetical protein